MDGRFVGFVSAQDPLHGFLDRVLRERLGVRTPYPVFRVHRLSGSNEVYAYEETATGTRLVCKFFGPRFGWDRDKAAWTAGCEYEGYRTLRGYSLVGSPHHVVRPLAWERDINCVLAVEYYRGDLLIRAIDRAVGGDGRLLRRRLTALAWYLATQHNRTAGGAVDFAADVSYLDDQLRVLTERGRIGGWETDELRWLGGLWAERGHMWADQAVWLHGDATPANFLFGGGQNVGVIDLERMKRGDRMFDVGRLAGELQHAFLRGTGDPYRAEPFIGHFLWEYSCHFPDRHAAFASITRRLPFYMAQNMLRIARNDYLPHSYAGRLVGRARELLQAVSC